MEPRTSFERVILAMARVAVAEREAAKARYRIRGGGDDALGRYRDAIDVQRACQDDLDAATDALVRETGSPPNEPTG